MFQKNEENALSLQPVVCPVGERYVICVPAPSPGLMSVCAGGQTFWCTDNGVRVNRADVQRFSLPAALLDRAGAYSVTFARMDERAPYHPKHGRTISRTFSFYPIKDRYPLRIALLSDVHGLSEPAARAARFFGDAPDLLILNGDVSSSSGSEKEALLPLSLAYEITKGEHPTVITRGNHDLRGEFAPQLGTFYPTDGGKMYYTVSLACCRLLVLDCGEDKEDSHPEYGDTAAFHAYRLEETEFLEKLSSDGRYRQKDHPHLVVCHIPFPHLNGDGDFRIEETLYRKWCALIKEGFHPDLALFGHVHRSAVYMKDDPYDTLGLGCPIVTSGVPKHAKLPQGYTGAFITLYRDKAAVCFADAQNKTEGRYEIAFSK